MATTYSYQTTEELREIDADLTVNETLDDPLFNHLPIVTAPTWRLVWDQRDGERGLMSARGLNGEPTRITALGANRFAMEPGVYGNFADIDEAELTVRASMASPSSPVTIDDLVSDRQARLLVRQVQRIRWLGWQLLVYGRFTVLNEHGAVVHQDSYNQQTFDATVGWGTPATATPIADFRAVARLTLGTSSASLGANAVAYMNQNTFDDMMANTNASDLGGQKIVNQNPVRSIQDVNSALLAYGLPRIVIYNEGYVAEDGTFTFFIPDNRVVVIGARNNGATIGDFAYVRNANNPGSAPGPYYKVIDHGETKVPRSIEVHRGFNGGNRLYYPNAVAVMDVS